MSAIDVGATAINRAGATNYALNTVISLDNPANNTGYIFTFEVWFNQNATGVKIGTFSGSGTDYNDRDYETIGNITGGSKQTFSGLNCDVVTGDYIGYYETTGWIEEDAGGLGIYRTAEDTFGQGVHTYLLTEGAKVSVYGIGVYPESVDVAMSVLSATANVAIPAVIGAQGVSNLNMSLLTATAEAKVPTLTATTLPTEILVMFSGQYATKDTPVINAILVIGRDVNGDPVTGTYVDSTEAAKVGTRYDVLIDSSIPTAALADDIADEKAVQIRLQSKSAQLIAWPHCGIEMYDVVAVGDALNNQINQYYRVIGITHHFDLQKGLYRDTFRLSAV